MAGKARDPGRISTAVDTGRIATRIVRLPIDSLELLKVNARFMRHETFTRLVENIKRDGALTSVPFACKQGDKYLILSGNHRVMAAKEAGLTEVDVMVTDDDLPKARRLAIQLSHNALTGEDDQTTLRQIWDELEGIDWREYAGLDDKTLLLLDKVNLDSVSEVNLSFQTITMAFLPQELEKARKAWEDAKALITGDEVWLARMNDYGKTFDALNAVGDSYHIKNVAVQFALYYELFYRHQDDLKAGWLAEDGELKHKGWIPMATLFGVDRMPADAARVVSQAVNRMVEVGDLDKEQTWRALELWAADYLAGNQAGKQAGVV